MKQRSDLQHIEPVINRLSIQVFVFPFIVLSSRPVAAKVTLP